MKTGTKNQMKDEKKRESKKKKKQKKKIIIIISCINKYILRYING